MTAGAPLEELGERARVLGEFIRDQRRVARLSLRKLGELAEVSNPYLSQIERGLRKPSAEILQQLAKGLRISAESLYVQAGILEERPDTLSLERAIFDEPSLTEAQKRALVQVYRSFQSENVSSPPPEPTRQASSGPQTGPARPQTGPARPASSSRARRSTTKRDVPGSTEQNATS